MSFISLLMQSNVTGKPVNSNDQCKSLVFCDFFQGASPMSDERRGDESYGSDWNGSMPREGTVDPSLVICLLQFTSILVSCTGKLLACLLSTVDLWSLEARNNPSCMWKMSLLMSETLFGLKSWASGLFVKNFTCYSSSDMETNCLRTRMTAWCSKSMDTVQLKTVDGSRMDQIRRQSKPWQGLTRLEMALSLLRYSLSQFGIKLGEINKIKAS